MLWGGRFTGKLYLDPLPVLLPRASPQSIPTALTHNMLTKIFEPQRASTPS
jgi:hypothetical protein